MRYIICSEFEISQGAVNRGLRAISLNVIFSQKHKQDRLDIYKISMIEMARMQMTILNDPYNPNTWFNIL